MKKGPEVDPSALRTEAMDWVLRLMAGPATQSWAAFDLWCGLSPKHLEAARLALRAWDLVGDAIAALDQCSLDELCRTASVWDRDERVRRFNCPVH